MEVWLSGRALDLPSMPKGLGWIPGTKIYFTDKESVLKIYTACFSTLNNIKELIKMYYYR